MFKGSKVEYTVNRLDFDPDTGKYNSTIISREMDITVKGKTIEESEYLFENLVTYLQNNTTINFEVTYDSSIAEQCDDHFEYTSVIPVVDKEDYDELKDAYKEWKKIAKTIVMPVESEEVKQTNTQETEINHNSDVQGTNATIDMNKKVAITETQETSQPIQPQYVIHTEPIDNPYSIGRVIRVDLYNNFAITNIPELQNYVLEQYTEGHVNHNRQVTYWKIVDIKT